MLIYMEYLSYMECKAQGSIFGVLLELITINLNYCTDVSCPCTKTAVHCPHQIPSFINNNYFCDTGNPGPGVNGSRYYTDDPLWDGQGCCGNRTCCEFNTPLWFCASLPQPTSDNLELRNCYGDSSDYEDKITITLIEIYVK